LHEVEAALEQFEVNTNLDGVIKQVLEDDIKRKKVNLVALKPMKRKK
jgi:hypothetical protein